MMWHDDHVGLQVGAPTQQRSFAERLDVTGDNQRAGISPHLQDARAVVAERREVCRRMQETEFDSIPGPALAGLAARGAGLCNVRPNDD